jgi:hypothetical protein
VADGWCWFVLREEYCWLVADGWFVVREKYCWLVADKPSEQGVSSEVVYQKNKFCGSFFVCFSCLYKYEVNLNLCVRVPGRPAL